MADKLPDSASSLQDLFASLRPTSGKSLSSSHSPSYHQSSAQTLDGPSKPLHLSEVTGSPRPQNKGSWHSHHSPSSFSPSYTTANVSNDRRMSKNNTPTPSGDQSTADRTTNLLNLLKFSGPTNSTQSNSQNHTPASRPGYGSPDTHSIHGRGISASDLVGSFMGKASPTPARENVKPLSSSNHQNVLLKLLNRSAPPPVVEHQGYARQPSQDAPSAETKRRSSATPSAHASASSSRHDSPIRYFGSSDDVQPTPFEPQDMPKPETVSTKTSMFTYVNPFEQLAASSPRNAKALTPNGEGKRRKVREGFAESTPPTRKLTPGGSEIMQSIESPIPTPLDDGRTRVEALMGIGAPSQDAETVAEALNEVGNQVDRQVENSLAKAEAKAEEMETLAEEKKKDLERAQEATMEVIEDRLHDVAVEVKRELDKDENKGILEDTMPAPAAEAVKEIIDEAAQDNGGEAWESAEGEHPPRPSEAGQIVRVYQFPLRPFVAIDIKRQDPPEIMIRDESFTHIARLKKDFDQTDRTLATATTEFIVYASPKTGGIRVIRQDDGLAKHVFSDTRDRVFNVSLATARPSTEATQTVLATGLSGTVYWTAVYRPGEDILESGFEKETLVFPPPPSNSDHTSGGQLKTRAKRCNRHPEIFAIGRGKTIQIVFPLNAKNSEFIYSGQRIGEGHFVDTEKYLKDRSIKISTGKAGKDFTFSEDDSLILTLDKAGRLKFWDARELIDPNNSSASKLAPIEIKVPMMSLNTASTPNDKSWPTSVLFVDKLRPYTKGSAHRYVIVGMKQNHTLQLWDLCLNKAVQELNFPHDKETDPICSVSYHPGSGIVVVGHPTRNSIYFIHLSAPKYNLPNMSQAKFVQRLANKDSTLPRPEATAILSGLREYSFGATGQIRSVELAPSSSEGAKSGNDAAEPPLFDLYIMHSKGVMSLSVTKRDLGWSNESKVLHPVDAEREGFIVVKDLREPPQATSEPSSTNGDHFPSVPAHTPIRGLVRESNRAIVPSTKRGSEIRAENGPPVPAAVRHNRAIDEDESGAASATLEKAEKRKKRTKREAELYLSEKASNLGDPPPEIDISTASYSQAVQGELKPPTQNVPDTIQSPQPASKIESVDLGNSFENLDQQLRQIESTMSSEFHRVLNKELESLYRRFDEDKRVQKATGAANQDAMLRLVASTLGENVEKSLSRIIRSNIQQDVLPHLTEVTKGAVDRRLPETLTQQLHTAIPPLLKLALPEAVSRGVQNPDVLRLLSEQLTAKVTIVVEREVSNALHRSIVPALESFVTKVAQKVSSDADRRIQDQLQQAELQHRDDSLKIEQLTSLVRGLSETVQTMAATQSEFQQEILKLQQQAMRDRQASISASTQNREFTDTSDGSTPPRRSPEQEAIEAVTKLLNQGQFEEGTIYWLQSEFQDSIFTEFLVQYDPGYLQQLSPLLNLSVGAAITASFETNLKERLTWLEDQELRDVGPRIMEVLKERLETYYMSSAEVNPNEPALRQIPPLARQAREMIRYFRYPRY
ncbi:MAG: hypothetical protein Q9190_006253 [Brigantiaea leucoxantha]